ncbi:molecular chaperone [Acidipila sp. EB88]|uniref:fimbrial biogenesis chaperone n=1 Tax=Acidipila sp. EB88 TaxID=2305226 RepID=UPI0013156D37|nr:fimbria/pilus periplasmic chaperone [Acidipila sp. EB88]
MLRKAVASVLLLPGAGLAGAQALAVMPISVALLPGQKATSLTVVNKGQTATSVQIRVYGWSQSDGDDHLVASDIVMASPPIATIAPNASQTIRVVLRRSPEGEEETYRIILDQLPPPPEPGVVHVVLRMSIPIFAEPHGPVPSRLTFHLEKQGENTFLVASNTGDTHETLRDMKLALSDGTSVEVKAHGSPYILAGATRRWPLVSGDTLPAHPALRVSAQGVSGAIHQQVALADNF